MLTGMFHPFQAVDGGNPSTRMQPITCETSEKNEHVAGFHQDSWRICRQGNAQKICTGADCSELCSLEQTSSMRSRERNLIQSAAIPTKSDPLRAGKDKYICTWQLLFASGRTMMNQWFWKYSVGNKINKEKSDDSSDHLQPDMDFLKAEGDGYRGFIIHHSVDLLGQWLYIVNEYYRYEAILHIMCICIYVYNYITQHTYMIYINIILCTCRICIYICVCDIYIYIRYIRICTHVRMHCCKTIPDCRRLFAWYCIVLCLQVAQKEAEQAASESLGFLTPCLT